MTKRNAQRRAFTLLEVLLASLIAILLLAALYFALDVTMRQTQEGREGIDIENLSNGVFTRMNNDLSHSLAPMPPKSGGNTSGSTSSSTSTPTASTDPSMATGAGTDPTAAAAAAPATTDPTATTDPSTTPPAAADVYFQSGVMGTDKQLTVFISRLPQMLSSGQGLAGQLDRDKPQHDIVRVTYWVSQAGGLCRQEKPWVTADGVRDSTDPDLSNEPGDTLVPEVKDATFEYWDGGSWQSTWNPDGTSMSDDGVTPKGPPRAIRVTLSFSFPAAKSGGQPYEPTVIQVIPIRAAPGSNTPAMITPSTDPGTTSPDTSGSGSSGTGTNGSAGGGAGAAAGGGAGATTTSKAITATGATQTTTMSASGAKSTTTTAAGGSKGGK